MGYDETCSWLGRGLIKPTMKFSTKDIQTKKINEGLIIDEYCSHIEGLPIDGAIAHSNASFGPKINKDFTELFFVLEGRVVIDVEGKRYELTKEELFILPANQKHTIRGYNAKIFIACSPAFKPENISTC